ncbi:MAG: NADH-quinone oxidoreductase subunit M [Chloroflexi bacterium]|nr:MAG: NADH-quinone oxidoreductase subunit M [Chloroflexota bacterium]
MLTTLWVLPVAGGLLIALLPRHFAKWTAVVVTLVELGLAGFVAYSFDTSTGGYRWVEHVQWIPQIKVDYFLGIDGISVWLVVLNALIGLIAVLATPASPEFRTSRFLALLLVMQGAMTGVFMSVDLVLFYFFWEAMLIPAYFLLWMWGEGGTFVAGRPAANVSRGAFPPQEGPRPLFASLKFVLFTLAGSLLMLVGIIGEFVFTGASSFNLPDLAKHQADPVIQFGLFFLFAVAFFVKIPVFPFHGWLRDAYLAAPTPMLLLFAGVMGKTGAYSMLRILVPLFHDPTWWWNWNGVVPVLGVLGIIWGALMALAQADMKALVAYSSLSHMGFIVLGIFSFNAQGQEGAVIQMVNHGLIVPALFLLVAWIQERTGTRDRGALFGLAPRLPVLAGVFLVVTLAALGLPGLNSFVGEFMILLGSWAFSPGLTAVASIGLVLAPIYMLRLFQGAMYAPATGELPHGHAGHQEAAAPALVDLRGSQLLLLSPLLALMFVIGLYPDLLTRVLTAATLGLALPWR